MAKPSLPHSIEEYHGKTYEISHERQVRNQNDTITDEFRFKIEVNHGELMLLITKNGQRRNVAKQSNQIRSLTADTLTKLLKKMEFDTDQSVIKKMKKSALVEFVCLIFHIPTSDALKICEADTGKIIENQISVVEQEPVIDDLIQYIEDNRTNMTIIADLVELFQQNGINLFDYLSKLWIALLDNFQIHKNDDLEYKKAFHSFTKSVVIINLQKELENMVVPLLNEYNEDNNKFVNQNVFWYSFNLCVLRYFNYTIKQYVISTFFARKEPTPMNEQRKVAIYKFFGSAFHPLKKNYKGKNYNTEKSEKLLYICSKCLLSYTTHDCEQGKSNHNMEDEKSNDGYYQIPLRLRLQNRGFLALINCLFYSNLAIKMYAIIVADIQQIFTCYDQRKIKQIEQKIVDDKLLFAEFDNIVGAVAGLDKNLEQEYKRKVLKDLAHKVTSRIALSFMKRNKLNYKYHIGEFRTGIKVLQSKR